MEKRPKLFRPLNTWGIYTLGIVFGSTLIYSIARLTPIG